MNVQKILFLLVVSLFALPSLALADACLNQAPASVAQACQAPQIESLKKSLKNLDPSDLVQLKGVYSKISDKYMKQSKQCKGASHFYERKCSGKTNPLVSAHAKKQVKLFEKQAQQYRAQAENEKGAIDKAVASTKDPDAEKKENNTVQTERKSERDVASTQKSGLGNHIRTPKQVDAYAKNKFNDLAAQGKPTKEIVSILRKDPVIASYVQSLPPEERRYISRRIDNYVKANPNTASYSQLKATYKTAKSDYAKMQRTQIATQKPIQRNHKALAFNPGTSKFQKSLFSNVLQNQNNGNRQPSNSIDQKKSKNTNKQEDFLANKKKKQKNEKAAQKDLTNNALERQYANLQPLSPPPVPSRSPASFSSFGVPQQPSSLPMQKQEDIKFVDSAPAVHNHKKASIGSTDFITPDEELPPMPVIPEDFQEEINPLAVMDNTRSIKPEKEKEDLGFFASLKSLLGLDKKDEKVSTKGNETDKEENNEDSFIENALDKITGLFDESEDEPELSNLDDKTLNSEKWFGKDMKASDTLVLNNSEDIIDARDLASNPKIDEERIRHSIRGKSLEDLARAATIADKVPEVIDNSEDIGLE